MYQDINWTPSPSRHRHHHITRVHTNIKIHKFTNSQIHKFTNSQLHNAQEEGWEEGRRSLSELS
jgi:hypothetical protein